VEDSSRSSNRGAVICGGRLPACAARRRTGCRRAGEAAWRAPGTSQAPSCAMARRSHGHKRAVADHPDHGDNRGNVRGRLAHDRRFRIRNRDATTALKKRGLLSTSGEDATNQSNHRNPAGTRPSCVSIRTSSRGPRSCSMHEKPHPSFALRSFSLSFGANTRVVVRPDG
jgi:hypothetical protein